jgi:hypothetical protein
METQILSQIYLLEYNFYNIDSGLIQHPELCNFANQLETIKTNITTILKNNNSNSNCNSNIIPNTNPSNYENIDYKQLQSLSTK